MEGDEYHGFCELHLRKYGALRKVVISPCFWLHPVEGDEYQGCELHLGKV